MGEPGGFLAKRIENIQGEYVPNDVPRAGIHRCSDYREGGGLGLGLGFLCSRRKVQHLQQRYRKEKFLGQMIQQYSPFKKVDGYQVG